ncbi:sodium-dependent phosphate transporter 1-B-like isoform X2 [Antedon mediterranea]|uniref:sodium-dependent phosphate transporter 1-B-like isoform X2 n=1 Tax=Antedon mediterranea TaxID=105859 RepID=UPI003AF75A35
MEHAFDDIVWMIVVGFILSFVLAFALGANDVANSFGTAVGSKALTLLQACILATIFETLGAVLLGAKVSDTIRKGLFDVGLYDDNPQLLMVGQISALIAASTWLLIATALKLPVSGTHSTVGAMLGFHLVAFGAEGVKWKEIILIVCSWVVSPLTAGIVSSLIFIAFRKYVMDKEEPLEPGLKSLPFLYCVVIIINLFSIFYGGPGAIGDLEAWVVFLIALGAGFLFGTLVWLVYVPRVRQSVLGNASAEESPTVPSIKYIKEHSYFHNYGMNSDEGLNGNLNESIDEIKDVDTLEISLKAENKNVHLQNGQLNSSDVNSKRKDNISVGNVSTSSIIKTEATNGDVATYQQHSKTHQTSHQQHKHTTPRHRTFSTTSRHADEPEWQEVKDHPHVTKICLPLQILSSVFGAFAHGGNDISNAIGPFVALWVIYTTGDVQQEEPVAIWILVYGSAGVAVGLWVLGKRVIETVGEDLTPLTVSSAFTIELGSATTVLVASNLGIPISTTHCKVGSVVAVGWVRTKTAVDWKLFYSIIAAWIITLPATVGLSALSMFLLQKTVV